MSLNAALQFLIEANRSTREAAEASAIPSLDIPGELIAGVLPELLHGKLPLMLQSGAMWSSKRISASAMCSGL